MLTIQEIFGPIRVEGDVGLEIEIEGKGIPKGPFIGEVWEAKPDNSLRGECMEYVSRPMFAKDLRANLDLLNSTFKAYGSEVFDAHRGSVHIHVNAQKLTIEDVFKILYVWSMIEPLWMHLCGPTREHNLFCLPTSTIGDDSYFATQFLKMDREKSYHNLPRRGKYAAVNTDCLARFGTLEFRTFKSTLDVKLLETWTKWCMNLIRVAKNIDLNNLSQEWMKVEANPYNFALDILGFKSIIGLKGEVLDNLIRQNLRNTADLVLVWADHKTKLKMIKVEAKPKKEVKPKLKPWNAVDFVGVLHEMAPGQALQYRDIVDRALQLDPNMFIHDEVNMVVHDEVDRP